MSRGWRLALLAGAFLLLAPAVWRIAATLPPFGFPTSAYGTTINALIPAARHVSNMVAAVNFDLRGFDTLGEESMLLCAVTGAVILLRGTRGEDSSQKAGRLPGRGLAARADATVLVCRFAGVFLLLFGVYVVLHGTATPGGGFQGGVIAASSFLLIYLGEGYGLWRKHARAPALALLEGGGTFIYVAAAAVPLLLGYAALQNILPLGTFKDMYSGGLMLPANAGVALSVTGSFGLMLIEFLEETRAPEDDSMPNEEDG
jgi:multicomponent Na+:H+ antiporter subunit B